MDLPLNPASEKLILATINDMPQSLLITGPSGVGLSASAVYISKLLKTKPIIILPEREFKVDLEKGLISIEIMRTVIEDVRTKSVGKRVIIIDYAERMSSAAQSAFLKSLEEPSADIYFILVSNFPERLLSTILSRVRKINIKPITDDQSLQLLDDLGVKDVTKRSQLLFMASGLPAELSRLSTDNEYFEKCSNIMRDARELLQGKLYRRLLIAQKYKDDRSIALKLLMNATKILKHSIDDKPQIDIIKRIDIILKAYERIEANGNIRLCLAGMVL